jgi:Fe-S-cluster-containing dehydrogenase component/formate-dependent nitrite reductase membrane component NrfD
MNFGFVIDNRKCIGCHACTVACKAENEVPLGVNRTWVKYIEKGTFPNTRRLFTVMRCNHCADAPCVEICPVSALFTRADGIVDFDDRRCIGCKACTQACPYDAIYMHPDEHTSAKCNYCSHRVDIGLEPACVNVCPEHAIISGDLDDPESEISKLISRETVTARKVEKGTKPKLFYIEGDRAALDPMTANPDTEYMWSSQASGVGHFARYAESKKAAAIENFSGSVLAEINNDDKAVARRVYDAPAKGILWGWEVTAYVWTKAIASGVFSVPVFMKWLGFEILENALLAFVLVSLFFLAVTGGLLVKDLGRPERFLYVLLRPQWRSWLTRGAYIITAYGLLLTGWLTAYFAGISGIQKFIEAAGFVFSILTAIYTAFLFAQARGRDFWQSPMLVLHMLIHSFLAGSAVTALVGLFLGFDFVKNDLFAVLFVSFILISLLTLISEISIKHPSKEATLTVLEFVKGRFSLHFWLGVILVGHVLPLILLITAPAFTLPISAILVLAGILVTEHVWVKTPQLIPLS